MMLTILMQRPNSNAGMGAAFGGGITESTFGADTTNILTRTTRYAAIAFFVISISLFMLHIKKASLTHNEESLVIPEIAAEASAEAVVVTEDVVVSTAEDIADASTAAATTAVEVTEDAATAIEDAAAEELPAAEESSK